MEYPEGPAGNGPATAAAGDLATPCLSPSLREIGGSRGPALPCASSRRRVGRGILTRRRTDRAQDCARYAQDPYRGQSCPRSVCRRCDWGQILAVPFPSRSSRAKPQSPPRECPSIPSVQAWRLGARQDVVRNATKCPPRGACPHPPHAHLRVIPGGTIHHRPDTLCAHATPHGLRADGATWPHAEGKGSAALRDPRPPKNQPIPFSPAAGDGSTGRPPRRPSNRRCPAPGSGPSDSHRKRNRWSTLKADSARN